MTLISRHLRITGRVQGVWFRAWTEAEACARGLSGWVRNEPDGSVSALIAGPEAAVQGMIEALHEGPPQARVAAVEVAEAPVPVAGGFSVLR